MTEQEINNLIDSKIGKTKMSQLPEATQTSGLYSIGYTGNQSVKYKANLLQGDPLTVRKTYQTEAEALADKNPIDATTSLPLKVGQFVSIVDDGEKNGIYRISSIGVDGTMSLELQGRLGDLSDYATHGYESNPKTLKEVDDNFIKYLDYYKIDNWVAGAFLMPVDSDDNVSLSPNENLNFRSLKIECEEGDVFKITTKSTYTYGYTYAFVNENGTILKASSYTTVEYSNKEETAPFGVKYLLVTSLASFSERDVYMYKASSLKNTIFELDKTKYYVGLTKVDFSDSILKKYYNFPSVGTTVDLSTILTDNSTFACIAVDCKGGDVFIASASATANGIGVFAILDEDNKVILHSMKTTNLNTPSTLTDYEIVIPDNGRTLLFNYSLVYRGNTELLKADEKSILYKAINTQENYGHYKFNLKDSTTSGIKMFYSEGHVPQYLIKNNKIKVITTRNDLNLFYINLVQTNGSTRIIPLNTSSVIDMPNSNLIGFFFTRNPYNTEGIDVECEVEIFTNDAYILYDTGDISNKIDKVHDAAENNIPIFDEHGGIKDSSYNINNLPESLPSGGSVGEVLKTDGNGNHYWGDVPRTTTTDVSQIFGVLVDQYEELNTGISWVNAIRKAVEVAGEGGVIIFTPNKTYVIDSGIAMMKGQTIIGNNATLQRANKSQSTLSQNVSASSVLTVANVPSDWAVGDSLFIHTGSTQADVISYGNITNISGNTITIDRPSITATEGAYVTKSFRMLYGSQYPIPIPFKVYNLNFDGNKDNNDSLYYWYIHGTISTYGFGSIISGCKFYNIPTENIICQGAIVENCYAENLNGSFVHLSSPKTEYIEDGKSFMGTFITNNMVKGSNIIDPNVTGHSSCVIEQSWNPGKLIVMGNQFYSGGYGNCFNIGSLTRDIETSTTEDQAGYTLIVDNIFEDYTKICTDLYTGDDWTINNKMMVNNIFRNCGTTNMRYLYKFGIFVEQNLLEGNTVINKWGNTLMYRIDTEISSVPTASALNTKYSNLPEGGQVYITQINKQYRKIKTNNINIVWLEESVSILN